MSTSSTSTLTQTSSPQDAAIRLLCRRGLHQLLWLPETSQHPKLRVTFSTTSNFEDDSLPAILHVGPMFGTRYGTVEFDALTKECGVRMICVDRPGFGGSTPVSIDIRMAVWHETVPALLQRLNLNHVSLMTHSAGGIYTLNTLLHHRSLLNPKTPYVAFMAAYVPMTDSGATLPNIASHIPTSMVDSWSTVAGFINTKIMPATSWSGGALSASASFLTSPFGTNAGDSASSSTTPEERYGVDKETAKCIADLSMKYMSAESILGANEEAKLCLRKCEDADWGDAADYASCITKIGEREGELGDQAKLKVDGFFAGSDVMIGKQGQEFFEKCWRSDEVARHVDFESRTYEKADHDSLILDYKKGALRDVFRKVAELGKT
ncbi:hypothetical protein LTR95_009000 [Oleoguttula sp. CCFEE 5521]